MIKINTLNDFKKLLKTYEKRAMKEPARYTCNLFLKSMKEEKEQLTYFSDFKKLIDENATIGQLQKEVNKAHKDATKHRERSNNSGMTCIPPFILSNLLLILKRDIEILVIMYRKNDGNDLIKIHSDFIAEKE